MTGLHDAARRVTRVTLLRSTLRATAQLAWIPSALWVLLLFAAAVAPAFALASLAISQVPAGTPLILLGLAWGLVGALAYALFCLTFPALVVASRLGRRRHVVPERIRVTSPRMMSWYHGLLCAYAVHRLAGSFLRSLGLYRWFAIGMGMKVGRGSVLNTTNVYDHDLIELGDDVVVGGDAFLTGHVVEGGYLIRRRMRIGDRAVIGLHAVLLPGCTVGADCHVGAMALVPKDAILQAGVAYGGVPARPLRKLRETATILY